jgi:hypothetical protein
MKWSEMEEQVSKGKAIQYSNKIQHSEYSL